MSMTRNAVSLLVLLACFAGRADASDIRVTVKVRYDNGSPAAGLRIDVRERYLDGLTWRTVDYPIGTLNAQGELINAVVRPRKQHTVRSCGGIPLRCTSVQKDDPGDIPMLTIMVRNPSGGFHSHDWLAVYGDPVSIDINLPSQFSSGLFNVQKVGHLLLRRNLNRDFDGGQQETLAGLVSGELTSDIVQKHMEEIDHINFLFSDHRSYIYEIEKKLIANGNASFVPLPIWEPVENLPPRWDEVKPLPGITLPIRNPNDSRLPRPQLPNTLRPERICAENFPRAIDVAEEFGKSALSSIGSYHFNSHAMLAGPFLLMSTAAAGVVFWPYHALLVDVYDKWLSCKFGQTTQIATALYRDNDDSVRMALFRVGGDHKLWHSYERRTSEMRNDLDIVMGPHRVTFDHWSHWEQTDNRKDLTRFEVVRNGAGRIVVLAKGSDNRLFAKQGFDTSWSEWRDLGAEVGEFTAVLGADNLVEVIAVRRNGTAFEIATAKEASVGIGDFGGWTRRATASQSSRIEAILDNGRVQVFFTNATWQLYHLAQRADGGWNAPVLNSSQAVRQFQVGRQPNGNLELIVLRPADDGVYHRQRYLRPGRPGMVMVWGEWTRLGSVNDQFDGITLGQNRDGRLELFGLGVGGDVWNSAQTAVNGGWSTWARLPFQEVIARRTSGNPRVRQLIGAQPDRKGVLRVFVQARDGFIYMAEQRAPNQTQWIGWTTL